MTPRYQNFTVLPTQTWDDTFVVPYGANGRFDFSDLSAVMTIGVDKDTPLAVLTLQNNLLGLDISDNPIKGLLAMAVPLATVQAWPAGDYAYILVANEEGAPREIVRGVVHVESGLRPALQILRIQDSLPIRIVATQSGDLMRRWQVLNGGSPLDLTGYTATLIARPSLTSTSVIASWNATSGQISKDVNVLLSLVVRQSAMAAISPGEWPCLIVISGALGTFELARGTLSVLPGVVS